jgi:hypothetical protein
MGMDVYGILDRDAYFHASIWSWPTVLHVTVAAAEVFGRPLDEKLIDSMRVNDGAGVTDAAFCVSIADEIDAYLDGEKAADITEIRVKDEKYHAGHALADALISSGMQITSPMRNGTTITHLREWVAFLRKCGGFEVH